MALLDTRTVMITLTENCNLSCSYCYEHNKTISAMNFETAKKIIDEELKSCTVENIEFDLFGGEPFLNFKLIQQIDTYLKEVVSNYNIKIVIFASTNGTLIHGEMQKWLEQRKDYFICGLSFDGTNVMQDINRSNSSSLIDLDFFKSTYPNQTVKMTVSVETLHNLSEGVIFLHNKGFEVICNLAYNIDWSDYSNKSVLEYELHKLIEYYLYNPDVKVCSMLDAPISNVAVNYENRKYVSYCGAGVGTVAYDVLGNKYPCHFFMPLSIGDKKTSGLKFFGQNIPENMIEDKCKKCSVQVLCPTCYGANYAATGDMFKHDDNYCKLTKIIIKARSYFKARQWELGQLNLSSDEETLLLKSIQIIQENL